eukprot:3941968-Rhodomonas_salina.4
MLLPGAKCTENRSTLELIAACGLGTARPNRSLGVLLEKRLPVRHHQVPRYQCWLADGARLNAIVRAPGTGCTWIVFDFAVSCY